MEESPAARKRDPQARIRAIRKAASDIIVEDGAEALTHRAVAKRAGVAVGTTTKYFKTLDDLRVSSLELMREESEQELDYIAEGMAKADDEAAFLAGMLDDFYSDPRRSHADAAMAYAEIFNEDIHDLGMHWSSRFSEILDPYIRSTRAQTLMLLLHGYAIDAAVHNKQLPRPTLEAIIRGILNMPVSEGDET